MSGEAAPTRSRPGAGVHAELLPNWVLSPMKILTLKSGSAKIRIVDIHRQCRFRAAAGSTIYRRGSNVTVMLPGGGVVPSTMGNGPLLPLSPPPYEKYKDAYRGASAS